MPTSELPIVTDLRDLKATVFITRWFDEATPHLSGASRAAYLEWKSRLAADLGVSWLDVVLVGSAAVGYPPKGEADHEVESRYSRSERGYSPSRRSSDEYAACASERFTQTSAIRRSAPTHRAIAVYDLAYGTPGRFPKTDQSVAKRRRVA
jgi:hypothetical protein